MDQTFTTVILALAALGSGIWWLILLQPWASWRYREFLNSRTEDQFQDLSKVTVLIPARNEEEEIGVTLLALKDQGPSFKVVLVNDQSTDRTENEARKAFPEIQIIEGAALPAGWAGKLWALEQGRKHIQSDYILLMDADIQLKPGILKSLIFKLEKEKLDFVSLMAALRMDNFWEKLLVPAYIYFFKLLYPFALGNSPQLKFFAVAAGGCILLRREALEKLGGFGILKDALIDDCTLAKKFKRAGYRTWMGTTRSVTSHRAYQSLNEIWNLVARFAFTYLKYRWSLLLICTALMFSAYWAIPIAWFTLDLTVAQKWLFGSSYALVFALYLPTTRFYSLSPSWVLLQPVAGTLYLAMTWSSALRYLKGRRSEWKGRTYDHQLTASSSVDPEDIQKEHAGLRR